MPNGKAELTQICAETKRKLKPKNLPALDKQSFETFTETVSTISQTYEIFDNAIDTFEPVLKYFETFYIGELMENSKTQRKQPLFPIAMWNVFELIERSLESWHKQFQVFRFFLHLH